ncbi:MAG: glycosyltransferase family 39 protein [Syntrophales bacterium]|nr:glycosyltransferase family 39 protein [Syntrophales bacterium]
MIVFFLVALLLSLTSGVLLTFIFLPSPKNDLQGLLLRLFVGGGIGIGLSACLYFVSLPAGLSGYIPLIDLAACVVLGLTRQLQNSIIGVTPAKAGVQKFLKRLDSRFHGNDNLGLLQWALTFNIFRKRGRRKAERPAESQLPDRKAALPGTGSKLETVIAAFFAVELLASLGSFLFAFLKEPHGKWDAWLIWNMHARFLYRSGEAWREVFAVGMDWSHWDYPLLLPLSIVRGWKYFGNDSIYIPAAFALLFTLLTIGLLLGALAFLRSRIQGCLAAMILLGTPLFIVMGASQFADVPLAFFILATLVLLFLPARSPENRSGALVLSGIAAGLCAWTKNEGLLFLLIVTGSLFGATLYADGWRSARKRTVRFLAGALPILLIVIYFKTQLSPANDLMAGSSPAAAAAKLTDFSRYAQIAKAFFITGISFTQGLIDIRVGMQLNPGAVNILLLIVYLLLAGVRIDDRDRTGLVRTAAVLLLMPAGYFFVYVMTPLDLGYHLATSLNRLFLQLWPSVIFLFFMTAGAPETAASAGERPGPGAGPGSTMPEKRRRRRVR